MIRISPDLWESKYTGEFEANNVARENKRVTVDEKIENKAGAMEPVTFDIDGYKAMNKIAFIDGVQRLDMHATIEDNGFPFQGIFSSNAAGYLMVNPNDVNSLSECFPEEMPILRRYFIHNDKNISVGNFKFNTTEEESGALNYEYKYVKAQESKQMQQSMTEFMKEIEQEIMASLVAKDEADMIIADGSLSLQRMKKKQAGKTILAGIIKSIEQLYISNENLPFIAKLKVGQRSPIFSMNYKDYGEEKFSFFIRLQTPMAYSSGFSNLARIEMEADITTVAIAKANLIAATMLFFASGFNSDARAPQNLYPVIALEKVLKTRLGDIRLIRNRIIDTL
jgi:hypothetical protein